MSRFQRFIRLYDPKGVLAAGCALTICCLILGAGGYLAGDNKVALGGFVAVVPVWLTTLLCAMIAMIRRTDRLTPGNDFILERNLPRITEDDLEPLDDVEFMDDLVANVPGFRV